MNISSLKIVIAGINYAPEPTGIAPYTSAVARGLAARGHQVHVLTGVPHYPQWHVDSGFETRRRISGVDAGVRLHRYPLVLGAHPTPRNRIRMEAGFAARVTAARWGRPDVVVAISPALLSAASVVTRARAQRIPVGVVVQDLYGIGVTETGALSGGLAERVVDLERMTLRRATSVAVIHDRFATHVRELGVSAERIQTIRNWTHIAPLDSRCADRIATRRRLGWANGDTIVLHAGNMGVKQGLENVVEAARLAELHSSPVRFVLLGDGNQRARLRRAAAGVSTIRFIDPQPDDEFRAMLTAADVLLVNELPEVGDMAVPSKLTSYAMAGRPVLAATRSDSATAAEITAAGFGDVVVPGDPAALLHGVVRLAADHQRQLMLGDNGRRFAATVLDQTQALDRYEHWCQSMSTSASGPRVTT